LTDIINKHFVKDYDSQDPYGELMDIISTIDTYYSEEEYQKERDKELNDFLRKIR